MTEHTNKTWADGEEQRARGLLKAGASLGEVATALGRSVHAVQTKLHIRHNSRGPTMRVEPAPDLVHERDTRLRAPMRDLTAVLMGDPPVGHSALERRQ